MKIGIFDSGLGGLVIAESIIQSLPEYDYVYLGDTARVPYGNRSRESVLTFTKEAVSYLFRQDCQLIIIACNTASAEALRVIQQEYLPKNYPDRRVLGVIIPTVEMVKEHQIVGVLATQSTVNSGSYIQELQKHEKSVKIIQQAAPLLVPLIENDELAFLPPILEKYLRPFKSIDTLILGCTHYSVIKNQIKEQLGESVTILTQDEIIPAKLKEYLERHPKIEQLLSKKGGREYCVTDLVENTLYGQHSNLTKVSLL